MKARGKKEIKLSARDNITELFQQAEKARDKKLSDRYVKLARNVSTKHKVRIPFPWSRRFCKSCFSFLRPGKNSRSRLTNGKISVTCLECGRVSRYGYKREQKARSR